MPDFRVHGHIYIIYIHVQKYVFCCATICAYIVKANYTYVRKYYGRNERLCLGIIRKAYLVRVHVIAIQSDLL